MKRLPCFCITSDRKARHRTHSAALVMRIQGANTVETVAVYIGMLGLDFTVTEPAELLVYLTRSRSVMPERSGDVAMSANIANMRDATEPTTPTLRQVVLDCEDARALAEFYRQLLGFQYRQGDEPPADGTTDDNGQEWLVLCDSTGTARLAFQQVPHLPQATWPEGPRPQMLHLDTTVP